MQCHGVWTELHLLWMKNNNSFIDIKVKFSLDGQEAKHINMIAFPKLCQYRMQLKATLKKIVNMFVKACCLNTLS